MKNKKEVIKNRGRLLVFIVVIFIILLMSFVSAGWFSDLWNRLTGGAIDESDPALVGWWKLDGDALDSSGSDLKM